MLFRSSKSTPYRDEQGKHQDSVQWILYTRTLTHTHTHTPSSTNCSYPHCSPDALTTVFKTFFREARLISSPFAACDCFCSYKQVKGAQNPHALHHLEMTCCHELTFRTAHTLLVWTQARQSSPNADPSILTAHFTLRPTSCF